MSDNQTTLNPSHNLQKQTSTGQSTVLNMGALAHAANLVIKGPKITNVKQFQPNLIYIKKTRKGKHF